MGIEDDALAAVQAGFVVVVDGPPASGRTSVVTSLRAHGIRAVEGGLPGEVVRAQGLVGEVAALRLEHYLLLDVPAEVLAQRLGERGSVVPSLGVLRDMVERFRRIAGLIRPPEVVAVIRGDRERKLVWQEAYTRATMMKLRALVRVRRRPSERGVDR